MTQTLSAELQDLLDPTPKDFDPEDLDGDHGRSKKRSSVHNEEEQAASKASKEKLGRMRHVGEEYTTGKYAGKSVSRNALNDLSESQKIQEELRKQIMRSDDEDDSEDDSQSADSDEDSEVSEREDQASSDDLSERDSDEEAHSDEEADEESDNEAEGEEYDHMGNVRSSRDEDELEQLHNEEQDLVKSLATVSDSEMLKAKSVREQKKMLSELLKFRIKLQKSVGIANRLPQFDMLPAFKKSNEEAGAVLDDCVTSVSSILGDLVEMSGWFTDANETLKADSKKAMKSAKKRAKVSASEDEVSSAANVTDASHKQWCEVNGIYEGFGNWRDEMVQYWNEKTQLMSGLSMKKQLKSLNQGVLTQIEHALSDQDRLLKRTQLKRTQYAVLGKRAREEPESGQSVADSHLNEYDEEIFDDLDFYQSLLREVIEANSVDLATSAKKLIEAEQQKQKRRKNVDRRASKGRKLRYTVDDKLVNFLTAIPRTVPEMANSLFANLFGLGSVQQNGDAKAREDEEVAVAMREAAPKKRVAAEEVPEGFLI